MKVLVGELHSLKASEKTSLEKLSHRRVGPQEIIGPDIARRTARLASKLERQIALLVERDGRITQVVVGTRNRVYLPDLGRFRLSKARLRRLRLLLFLPADGEFSRPHPVRGVIEDNKVIRARDSKKLIESPIITSDLRTDLEKLRLDALAVVASNNGEPTAISLVHLEPITTVLGPTTSLEFQAFRDVFEIKLQFREFIEELEARFRASHSRLHDTSREPAMLVGVYTESLKSARASMDELVELAKTADLEVVDSMMQRRRSIDPRTVLGRGKLEDVVLHCLDLGVDLLVFDRELSPGQLRSITNLTELRVIDRSMLILDIFAQRAKTKDGRLQVELAQLKYSLPRLTETNTGLSRLTGGIGGRGPGETKLEIGRRRARSRISMLEKKIDQVAEQRMLRRERRQARGVPVVAIVGYTNAGKSTLLNALTKGEVLVEGKLFATLDPASRRMRFPNDYEVVFVDTVGFIRELPKELVNAFRATLEEVGEADFLIHVVDATNPELQSQIDVVERTLADLGFDDKPQLLVLNKVDLLSPIQARSLANSLEGIQVSALNRQGFDHLMTAVQQCLLSYFKGQDPSRFLELPSTPT